VDYEVTIPEFYTGYLREYTPNFPYAIGLVLTLGDLLKITREPAHYSNTTADKDAEPYSRTDNKSSDDSFEYPQVIDFLKNYVRKVPSFTLEGQNCSWMVELQDRV